MGWKALSKDYKQKKIAEGLGGKANLTFEGDLIDSLTYKNTRDGLKIGWFTASEAPKADGHANLSGKSKLPTRRLIPAEGQKFKGDIQSEIEAMIAEYLDEQERLNEIKDEG